MGSGDRSLLRKFWSDLTTVSLLKAKFLWFTTLFSVVVIWPFLSLHMTSIGLSERDVGIASSLSAALTIICPFIFGFIADKIGNFKFLLSGLTFLCGIASLLFTVIPPSTTSVSPYAINDTEYWTNSTSANITGRNTTIDIIPMHQENDNYATTFWSYLAVRGFFVFVQGGSYTLFEGAVMSYMQEKNLDYGMQRAWGTLAVGISPMVGGKLNDFYGGMQLSFCLSAAFFFITAAALLFFDMEFKKPAKNLCKEIYSQIINAEIIMLLLTMMAVGALIGYIETFLYVYLFGMGASNILIGLAVSAGVPFEIVIQICATPIVGKIGHVNALVIGTFLYAIRTLGLIFLTNPWWVLPFEILEAMTGGLFMTAALMYCTELVTLSSVTSFRGLIGVFYWGIGKLVGSSIGTIIRENIGDRGTFTVMTIFALTTSIIYLTSYKLYKKYQSHQIPMQSSTEVKSSKHSKDKELEKGVDNPAWVPN